MIVTYRGRRLDESDIALLQALIARHSTLSRRQLSRVVCEAWGWRQRNGALRDMVCRGLLLALERAGWIELPRKRCSPPNPLAQRPGAVPAGEIDATPIQVPLAELRPLRWEQVRRTPREALFNGLLARYHYLGYTQPVGEHLKYLIYAGQRPVAAMAWSSAPRHLGPRDRFIGWRPEARRRNLHLIAYQPRFLILPWVRVAHLASHLLARTARLLSEDWCRIYAHPLHYLETFTDPQLFAGTCYRAANWTALGLTTGRGKNDCTRKPNRPLKMVWGYPLTPRFRELLQGGAS
jgi:uncharacterized protein DUF4338